MLSNEWLGNRAVAMRVYVDRDSTITEGGSSRYSSSLALGSTWEFRESMVFRDMRVSGFGDCGTFGVLPRGYEPTFMTYQDVSAFKARRRVSTAGVSVRVQSRGTGGDLTMISSGGRFRVAWSQTEVSVSGDCHVRCAEPCPRG